MRTFKLYYKSNTGWIELKNWSRPLFGDDKLDDELDEANIDFNCVALQELPPFTDIKVEIYENDILAEEQYFTSAELPEELRTFSLT